MTLNESLAYEVLERTPMPALVADDSGQYTYANPAACALLGRPQGELVGMNVAGISAPDVDVDDAWQRFTADGAQEGEFRICRPDGTIVPVHFRASREFLPGRHVSFLSDITERKRIETQIRRNEEFYLRAFAASPAPTNIRRLSNGVFVDVNEAFTRTTGFWRSDVVGRNARGLGLWPDLPMLEAILDDLRAGKEEVTTRVDLRTKARESREFSVAMRRIEVQQEDYVIAVYSDIASL